MNCIFWNSTENVFGLCLETIVDRKYVSLNFKVAFSIERCSQSDSSEGMSEMAQEATGSPSPFHTHSVTHMQSKMTVRVAYCLY